MDAIDMMLYVIWGMLGLVIVGLIIYYFIVLKKYRYHVQIREIAEGRKLIYMDKAKEHYDEQGNKYLRLRKAPKKRRLMPYPSEDAIELDWKGRKHVIVYLSEGGDYQYGKDNVSKKELSTIPSDQKAFLASQIRRAQERKPVKWTDHIMTITGGIVIVMLFTVTLLFGGEFIQQVAEPAKALGKSLETATANMQSVQESIERVEFNIQKLETKIDEQNEGGAPN